MIKFAGQDEKDEFKNNCDTVLIGIVNIAARICPNDIYVTSVFRTVQENIECGGNPNSKHLLSPSKAIDIVTVPNDKFNYLLTFLKAVGFKVIDEHDHYHIQV
jgi:hypothetical protein